MVGEMMMWRNAIMSYDGAMRKREREHKWNHGICIVMDSGYTNM